MNNKASVYLDNNHLIQLSSIGKYEELRWDGTMSVIGVPHKHIGSVMWDGIVIGSLVGVTGKDNYFSSKITIADQNFESENVGEVG